MAGTGSRNGSRTRSSMRGDENDSVLGSVVDVSVREFDGRTVLIQDRLVSSKHLVGRSPRLQVNLLERFLVITTRMP